MEQKTTKNTPAMEQKTTKYTHAMKHFIFLQSKNMACLSEI